MTKKLYLDTSGQKFPVNVFSVLSFCNDSGGGLTFSKLYTLYPPSWKPSFDADF